MAPIVKRLKFIGRGILEIFFLILLGFFFFFAEHHLVEWGIFKDNVKEIDEHIHVELCWEHITFIGWYWGCCALWVFERLTTYIQDFVAHFKTNC